MYDAHDVSIDVLTTKLFAPSLRLNAVDRPFCRPEGCASKKRSIDLQCLAGKSLDAPEFLADLTQDAWPSSYR